MKVKANQLNKNNCCSGVAFFCRENKTCGQTTVTLGITTRSGMLLAVFLA